MWIFAFLSQMPNIIYHLWCLIQINAPWAKAEKYHQWWHSGDDGDDDDDDDEEEELMSQEESLAKKLLHLPSASRKCTRAKRFHTLKKNESGVETVV